MRGSTSCREEEITKPADEKYVNLMKNMFTASENFSCAFAHQYIGLLPGKGVGAKAY